MKEDLIKYSGEEFYRKPPKLVLPEIRLQGNEGSFKKIVKERNEYRAEDIGKELNGVILRIRRRLVDFKEKLTTSEHNHPNDTVMLFGPNEKGTAKDLRQKYPGLKTQQVVYFLLNEKELVKLIVRGASLGSENKPKDSVSFYEYLQSFGNDEHIWEYQTRLIPKPEKGKLATYFAIHFERGEKVEDLISIGEIMKKISDTLKAQDEYYKIREKESVNTSNSLPEFEEELREEPIEELRIEDL